MKRGTVSAIALGIILLSALTLRCIPLQWGIAPMFHPDEPKLTNAIQTFPTQLFEANDLRYPMLIHNVGGFFWRLVQPAIVIVEKAAGSQPVYSTGRFPILCMRLVNALIGLAALWLVYKTTLLFFDRESALIAAALMNLCTYHVLNSAVMTTDILSSFWVILTVYVLYRTSQALTISWRHAFGLGLLLGAAVSTKYTLLFLAPFFAALPMYLWRQKRLTIETFLLFELMLGAIAAMAIGFFTPAIFTRPAIFIDGLLYEYRGKSHPFTIATVIEHRMQVIYGLGWIVTFLSLAGIPFLYRMRRTLIPYLLLLPLLLYLYKMFPNLFARYLIAVAPLVVIIAAAPLRYLLDKHRLAPYAVAVLLTLGTVHTGYLVSLRYKDTRYQTVHWLQQHVSPSTPIGMGGIGSYECKQHAWTWPALTADYPKAPLESAPPYLILSARFYVPIESVLQSPELLKDTSFWSETGVPDKKALTFYDDILNGKSTQYSYTLKAEFTANPILEFNGDTLRIYEKCDNAKLQESHPTN